MEEWFADVSKKNPNTKMIFKEEELAETEKHVGGGDGLIYASGVEQLQWSQSEK